MALRANAADHEVAAELERQLREHAALAVVSDDQPAQPRARATLVLSSACATSDDALPILRVSGDAETDWVWDGSSGDAAELNRRLQAAILDHQLLLFDAGQTDREEAATHLRRKLRKLVAPVSPTAVVHVRPKSRASFAEKVVRRAADHANPAAEFGDLLGARLIVSTTREIDAVAAAVRAEFPVVEDDDKGDHLAHAEFGYRGLHLGIQWRGMVCELQIRTWLQHAWAELIHDRLYKSTVDPSAQEQRSASVLAALLEEGDRLAQGLADSIDDRASRFSRTQTRQKVAAEIDRLELLVADERDDLIRRAELGRLHIDLGDVDRAIAAMEPLMEEPRRRDPQWCSAESDLGHFLVQKHWDDPGSDGFIAGRNLLARARTSLSRIERTSQLDGVPVMLARTCARLGWATSQAAQAADDPLSRRKARELLGLALATDPRNPYLLADSIAMNCADGQFDRLGPLTRDRVTKAAETCQDHAEQGLQLPASAFTAARLWLLLGDRTTALAMYAVALSHIAAGKSGVGHEPIRGEVDWLHRMANWQYDDAHREWALALLDLASGAHKRPPTASMLLIRGDIITPSEAPHANLGWLDSCRPTAKGHYSPRTLAAAVAAWKRLDPLPGPGGFFLGSVDTCPVHAHIAMALGLRVLIEGDPEAPLPTGSAALLPDAMLRNLPWTVMPTDPDIRNQVLHLTAEDRERAELTGIDAMARQAHESFRQSAVRDAETDTGRPWAQLSDEYRKSNADQAAQIAPNLRLIGLRVVAAQDLGDHPPLAELSPEQVEQLARIEHARWVADKLRRGFRWARERDNAHNLHPDLLAWDALGEPAKDKDRNAVRQWPAMLQAAGYQVIQAPAVPA